MESFADDLPNAGILISAVEEAVGRHDDKIVQEISIISKELARTRRRNTCLLSILIFLTTANLAVYILDIMGVLQNLL